MFCCNTHKSEAVKLGATTFAIGRRCSTVDPRKEQAPPTENGARIKELEDKIWKLELDDGVKGELLLQAKEKMEADGKLVRGYSRLIGQLETQVNHLAIENRQLKGLPPGPTGNDNVDSNVAEAEVLEPEPPIAEEPLQGDEEELRQRESASENNN